MSHKYDGYAQIPNWFFSLPFTLKARCVYAALCLHDYGSHKVFPSEATLVKLSGVSRSKVYVALRELEEAGVITVEHRHAKSGVRQSNLYTLHQLREQDVNALPPTLARTSTTKREGDSVSQKDISSPSPSWASMCRREAPFHPLHLSNSARSSSTEFACITGPPPTPCSLVPIRTGGIA